MAPFEKREAYLHTCMYVCMYIYIYIYIYIYVYTYIWGLLVHLHPGPLLRVHVALGAEGAGVGTEELAVLGDIYIYIYIYIYTYIYTHVYVMYRCLLFCVDLCLFSF